MIILAVVPLVAFHRSPQASRAPVSGQIVGQVSLGDVSGNPPLRHAHVTAKPTAAGAESQSRDTDVDGRFSFDQLTPGTYSVSVAKAGYVSTGVPPRVETMRTVAVTAATPVACDFVVVHGAAIEGRVVSAGGQGASGVIVIATQNSDAADPLVASAKTDDLGRYRLHTLPASRYTLSLGTQGTPARIGQPMGPGASQPTLASGTGANAVEVRSGQVALAGDIVLSEDQSGDRANDIPPDAATAPNRQEREGVINGVVSDDSGTPLPDATIRLLTLTTGKAQIQRSDAKGTFSFQRLAAGRYTLTASAPGRVSTSFARGPKGALIDLQAGMAIDDVRLRLPAARAVGVAVVDEFGDPVVGVTLQLSRVVFAAGERRLLPVQVAAGADITNDKGEVRLYGLTPDRYFLAALVAPFAGDRIGYAPTFYPGVADVGLAQPIDLSETRDQQVILPLTVALTDAVQGTVRNPVGVALARRQVLLFPSDGGQVPAAVIARTMSGPDGSFGFAGVPAGHYVLQAVGSDPTRLEFGFGEVMVDGRHHVTTVVVVSAGRTARGRVTFEGGKPASARALVRPVARPTEFVSSPLMGMGVTPSRMDDDGEFEIPGLFGSRILRIEGSSEWWLKEVSLDGHDVTDTALDFSSGDIGGLEIVVSRRLGSIDGTFVRADEAVGDTSVIVFSTATDKWSVLSRFVRTAVATNSDRFSVPGLPSGTYYVLAVQGAVASESVSPALLKWAVPQATRVEIAEDRVATVTLPVVPWRFTQK
jgi:hypothetical protein